MTDDQKTLADILHKIVLPQFTEQDKIRFVAEFQKLGELEEITRNLEVKVANLELEHCKLKNKLMAADPISFFDNNGPYGVEKTEEHKQALLDLEAALAAERELRVADKIADNMVKAAKEGGAFDSLSFKKVVH